jgi:hypothetical protein
VVLGVYPKPVLDIINPAVHQTLVQVHSTDPVPPHPGTEASVARSSHFQGHGGFFAASTQRSAP